MTRRDLSLSRSATTSARDCALAPCRSRQVAGTRRESEPLWMSGVIITKWRFTSYGRTTCPNRSAVDRYRRANQGNVDRTRLAAACSRPRTTSSHAAYHCDSHRRLDMRGTFHTTADSVIVRFDHARATVPVDELDQALLRDGAHQIRIRDNPQSTIDKSSPAIRSGSPMTSISVILPSVTVTRSP